MPTLCKYHPHITLHSKEKMKETVVTYTSRNEVDKLLIEATANENWNISNSKL